METTSESKTKNDTNPVSEALNEDEESFYAVEKIVGHENIPIRTYYTV